MHIGKMAIWQWHSAERIVRSGSQIGRAPNRIGKWRFESAERGNWLPWSPHALLAPIGPSAGRLAILVAE